MKQLSEKEILSHLVTMSSWMVNKKRTEISKSFMVPSFVDGLALTARIAVHAEIINHHPEITLTYDKVTVVLSTHDVKGLTKLDFELAQRIDGMKKG